MLLSRQNKQPEHKRYLSPSQIPLTWILKCRKGNIITKSEWGQKAEWTVNSDWPATLYGFRGHRTKMGLLCWQWVMRVCFAHRRTQTGSNSTGQRCGRQEYVEQHYWGYLNKGAGIEQLGKSLPLFSGIWQKYHMTQPISKELKWLFLEGLNSEGKHRTACYMVFLLNSNTSTSEHAYSSTCRVYT